MKKIKKFFITCDKYGIGLAVSAVSTIVNLAVFSATGNYSVRDILLGVLFAGLFIAIGGAIADSF